MAKKSKYPKAEPENAQDGQQDQGPGEGAASESDLDEIVSQVVDMVDEPASVEVAPAQPEAVAAATAKVVERHRQAIHEVPFESVTPKKPNAGLMDIKEAARRFVNDSRYRETWNPSILKHAHTHGLAKRNNQATAEEWLSVFRTYGLKVRD